MGEISKSWRRAIAGVLATVAAALPMTSQPAAAREITRGENKRLELAAKAALDADGIGCKRGIAVVLTGERRSFAAMGDADLPVTTAPAVILTRLTGGNIEVVSNIAAAWNPVAGGYITRRFQENRAVVPRFYIRKQADPIWGMVIKACKL